MGKTCQARHFRHKPKFLPLYIKKIHQPKVKDDVENGKDEALDFSADHKKTFVKLVPSENLALSETRFVIGVCVRQKTISQSEYGSSLRINDGWTPKIEEA